MKTEELILAKCIRDVDPWGDENTGLDIGKYYVVDEIYIGQSNSSIKINGKFYNSVLFEFYNDCLEEFDIYHSKYSPYFKSRVVEDADKGGNEK